MNRLANLFQTCSHRTSNHIVPRRSRRFGVEALEGRQMMAADFTSAFGLGGQLVSIQKVALDSQGNRYAVGSFTGDGQLRRQ